MLRSSNYGVSQGHFVGMKDRVESFDRSEELPKNKKRHIFDLEEEDNMAMVDQAPDEIEDFFVRFTFEKSAKSRFTVSVEGDQVDPEVEDKVEVADNRDSLIEESK